MENSINYAQDRSAQFRHQVPDDLAPPLLTATDYIYAERCKQNNKLRDWYLDAKESKDPVDPVCLRSNFRNSRSFTKPTPAQELDHHKGLLIAGVIAASIIGTLLYFVR